MLNWYNIRKPFSNKTMNLGLYTQSYTHTYMHILSNRVLSIDCVHNNHSLACRFSMQEKAGEITFGHYLWIHSPTRNQSTSLLLLFCDTKAVYFLLSGFLHFINSDLVSISVHVYLCCFWHQNVVGATLIQPYMILVILVLLC